MSYKITEIEGIGEAYAEKLRELKIDTTQDLLDAGLTEAGRETIAQQTGIPVQLIAKWTNHADLLRVKGVGPQFAELLDASGINSVTALRAAKPDELEKKLSEVNAARNLTRRVPSAEELKNIIDYSASVLPVLDY